MAQNDSNPRNNVFFIDISADDDLSEAMFKGHLDLCGVRIPAAFTGTEIGFTESDEEDGTYNAVTWEGTAIALTVAAGDTCMFDPAKLSGLKWLKLTSNDNEAADRTVEPIWRDFTPR
jgi:hypothetical protein